LFFETERYPRISFVSDRISPRADEGNWTALGTITVKERDNPLEVPFTLRRDEPGRRVSGELDLDRLRYGVGTGEWSNTEWLGGTVTLYYDVPLGLDPLGN
jgi:polyisoprenoid-binding protein YceI